MADGERADRVFDAMRDGLVSLRFAPVECAGEPANELYRECLASVPAVGADDLRRPEFTGALRKVGISGAFDRYVLHRAWGLLSEHPGACLGVNVITPVWDVVWEAMSSEWRAHSDVAARLIIEISESTRFPFEEGRQFVRRLKQCGCRIAIDDFGWAYGVDAAMAIPEPDIVKIHPALLNAAMTDAAGRARFGRMVALANSLAVDTVVMGVGNDCAAQRACEAGAGWLQRVGAGRAELARTGQQLSSEHDVKGAR
ncbi:EAL domain-containing protein [Burkholderia vietnamiensis]|uniref:EAL domain-containing protein n=1 Tax=Burkholderia vietnamiensis TaxID=60552 RepID=UPI00402A62C5